MKHNRSRRLLVWKVTLALLIAAIGLGAQTQPSAVSPNSTPRAKTASSPPGETKESTTAESDDWKIYLKGSVQSGGCVSNTAFVIMLENKHTGDQHAANICNEMTSVDRVLFATPGKALVIGSAAAPLKVVNVIDLDWQQLADWMVGYSPSLSPDKRFVVFRKYYPPSADDQEGLPSEEYLAYDVEATPTDNRVNGGPPSIVGFYNVGRPLYPQGATNAPMDNYVHGDDPEQAHTKASDGFFWLAEADLVAFVDRWQGVNRLVVADLRGGARDARVTVKPIETADVVDLSLCQKSAARDLAEWSEHPEDLVRVSKIEVPPKNPGSVRLWFTPQACVRRKSMDVPMELGLPQAVVPDAPSN
jgi:hypothetical protein